jgi:hypothetical protein
MFWIALAVLWLIGFTTLQFARRDLGVNATPRWFLATATVAWPVGVISFIAIPFYWLRDRVSTR